MTPTFDARLEGLRNRFRERAAADRVALAAAWQAGEREQMRRLAHGLAGSGGTFGFAELSAAALALEEAIDADMPDPPIGVRVQAVLDRLALPEG